MLYNSNKKFYNIEIVNQLAIMYDRSKVEVMIEKELLTRFVQYKR